MNSAVTKWLFFSLLSAAFLLIGGSWAYTQQYGEPMDVNQGDFGSVVEETVLAPEDVVETVDEEAEQMMKNVLILLMAIGGAGVVLSLGFLAMRWGKAKE